MNTMHRGVHNEQFVSYVIRVRPLGPAGEQSTRYVYLVEVISDQPARVQFDSVESVMTFLRTKLDHGSLDTKEIELPPTDDIVTEQTETGEEPYTN